MYPVLFEIGPFKVFAWGLMLAIATIIAWVGISRKFKENDLNTDYVIEMIVLIVFCGILGGRSLYIILYQWQDLMTSPMSVLNVSRGISGLIWYGSFMGGLLAFFAYVKYRSLPFLKVIDCMAPYVALGYAIVRVGCFLNGCCYGEATTSIIGVVFPYVDQLHRYPTQLFSSALNLIIFGILIKLYPRRSFDGQVFSLYLILYALYRFIVEFFRVNTIYIGPFSWAQIFALGLLGIGAIMYLILQKRSQAVISEGR